MTADHQFYHHPTLNSPYECPNRHWELDDNRHPTGKIIKHRREVSFITPIPAPKRGTKGLRSDTQAQQTGADGQQYDLEYLIQGIRREVNQWRELPESNWRVTPETAHLLRHWRHHRFNDIRPFFCQVEAVETIIWLTEVAPQLGKRAIPFVEHIERSSQQANPGLSRWALKLATGAGKTTVMAMIIAWQTINAVRHRKMPRFTNGFLVVTPGITIRDRLRVLQPNDPDSYYRSRELVPRDMLGDLDRARIVITNYHAFMRRETMAVSSGGRKLLQGHGPEIRPLESEGQMLQRVMPELMGMKRILALNDEAHHCYREKPGQDEEGKLKSDERKEADMNREAARLWISGLEVVGRKLGLTRVMDLSATPFFLSGSGYQEGTLFPWTVSDFSLMDAIECGIVKLPRVPVMDNVSDEMPRLRDLWRHIGRDMPKSGRGKSLHLDPLKLPIDLKTALDALYGHIKGDKETLQVCINGVDIFHPSTGEVRSDGPDGIACWFVDTDYNEESFFVRQAYFPGTKDPYKALKTTLKAEINRDTWDTLRSDISRSFRKPESGRIAVKVINHLGDEAMRVFRV